MPYISQITIQEVNDRLDAISVVSDYVHLEKKGGRFWACCPFHQEKTGSFTVNPELKSYYCFGCHKGGSVINFVMEMDKLSFPEAIETLAKRYGVELVYEKTGAGDFSAEDEAKKKAKEELFELYHRMSGTFHHFLLKTPEAEAAKLYIMNRGISIEMIERFRLGYSPADRNWLHKFLSQKGYSREFLAASGLFSSRHPGLSFFSGRLMFPIADRQSRTVAFGGRFLPNLTNQSPPGNEPPKYINSPELSIYKKGETLFALDLALPEIRKTKTAYLVEGYMDVIALHQAGITGAIAPLGTSFTEEQAKLLKRWAEKIVLFFDTDGAGQTAAVKGIYTCRKNGLACALVVPEEDASSKDPADILRYYGPEALQKKAKCFINDFDYLITRARSLLEHRSADTNGLSGSSNQRSSIQGKARAVAFLFPYLDLLDSEVTRDSCIEAAADTFEVRSTVIADDYRRYTQERATGKKEEARSRQSGGRTGSPIRMNDELSLLIVVAVNYASPQKEKLFPKFRAALEISEIEDPNAKELYIALEECMRYGETSMDELLARISSSELRDFFIKRSASGEFSVNSQQLVADGIKKIKGRRLERRKDEIIIELHSLKKNVSEDDRKKEKELLTEIMQIDNELCLSKQGR